MDTGCVDKDMHGLTYVAKTWGMTITDIAESLEVSKQTATDWIKGRGRINQERLSKLSMMFAGIENSYLTKEELNAIDMINIRLHYLTYLSEMDSYEEEYVFLDDEGNECPDIRIVSPYDEEIAYLSDLKIRKELVTRIEKQILNDDYDVSRSDNIFLLFSQMTDLLDENNQKKIWLIDTIFEYVLYWSRGVHFPEQHKELVSDIEILLKKHSYLIDNYEE